MHPRHDSDFPYWLLVAVSIGLYLAYRVATDELYTQVITIVSRGVWVTVFVTIVAFTTASVFGLLLAVGSLSRFLVLRQLARFYIEIVRGIPILVLLFYIAFVAAPALVVAINWVIEPLGFDPMRTRDLSLMWRAVLALRGSVSCDKFSFSF